MKRRDLGVLAGSSLAAAAVCTPSSAQSAMPNSSLLKTTLTPLGGERAGNADGSIPAWTGGVTAPPLPVGTNAAVQMFEDERPLYTVDSSNMEQYASLLSAGTQAYMKKYGMSLQVYQTHRTAAAPQYVYDNTAKNAVRAKLNTDGRLGFTNAYGGIPFPIIDTSQPRVGGAQLIWNHLTYWYDASDYTVLAPGIVMINGKLLIVDGSAARSKYPYYDPKGSLETFDGYYSKGHYWGKLPASNEGTETIIWHTTNTLVNPDIVWSLVNGEGRVRKAPDEAFDTPSPAADGLSNFDESNGFAGNPSQYDWTYIGKQEMLVPYNCNKMAFIPAQKLLLQHFPDPNIVRWEKHRVWVVEATLHPGQRNVNAKRRFYIDEDTWFIMLGEGYDANGTMTKYYVNYNWCVPSAPSTNELANITYVMSSGDYSMNGVFSWAPFPPTKYLEPEPDSIFNPEAMAAEASF